LEEARIGYLSIPDRKLQYHSSLRPVQAKDLGAKQARRSLSVRQSVEPANVQSGAKALISRADLTMILA
jgi:hypothetical protein